MVTWFAIGNWLSGYHAKGLKEGVGGGGTQELTFQKKKIPPEIFLRQKFHGKFNFICDTVGLQGNSS